MYSSVCSRGDVIRIGGITHGLFRQFEDLLTVKNQFLPAMRLVERNQVSQRSHVRMRERREVLARFAL